MQDTQNLVMVLNAYNCSDSKSAEMYAATLLISHIQDLVGDNSQHSLEIFYQVCLYILILTAFIKYIKLEYSTSAIPPTSRLFHSNLFSRDSLLLFSNPTTLFSFEILITNLITRLAFHLHVL